jgi:hypothetical protein
MEKNWVSVSILVSTKIHGIGLVSYRNQKSWYRPSLAQSSRKLLVDTWQGGGGEYFHERFVRHHINITKYIVFIVFLW